jgi:hypothetical protein
MDPLTAIQGVLTIAKGINNTKLTQEIINLQQSVLKVVTENNEFLKANLRLQSELDILKMQLEVKGKIELRDGAYWVDEKGPYCIKCYDKDGQLRAVVNNKLENKMHCPSCDYTYQTEEQVQKQIKENEDFYNFARNQ